MGMYVEQNLMKGEIVLQKAKMSPVGAIVKWIFFVLFGIGTIIAAVNISQSHSGGFGYRSVKYNEGAVTFTIIFGVLCFIMLIEAIPATVSFLNNELGLTSKRLVGKVGIVAFKAMDAPLNKIQNISVSFGVFGRLFGYGAIKINTASGVFSFKGVRAPDIYKNIIMEQIDIYDKQETQRNAETLARAVIVGQTVNGQAIQAVQNQGGWFCTRCGAQNTKDALFCKGCGSRIQ